MFKYTAEYLATLGKVELRDLCRSNGISYASLNVESMRAALATVPLDGTTDATTTEELAENMQTMGTAEVLPAVLGEGAPFVVLDPPTYTPPRDAVAVFAANPKPNKTKVPKVPKVPREESHGVKRPAAETLCGKIWAWCDAQVAVGVRPEAANLRAHFDGKTEGIDAIDPTTCTVQYYRWRKFNGISGR